MCAAKSRSWFISSLLSHWSKRFKLIEVHLKTADLALESSDDIFGCGASEAVSGADGGVAVGKERNRRRT